MTLNPMPRLVSCKQQVKVPFRFSDLARKYCEVVSVVRDTESGSIGLSAAGEDCTVRIGEKDANGKENVYLVPVSQGSYRFMKNLDSIGCSEIGEGMYANCSAVAEMGVLKPKDHGYDYFKEVIVDEYSSASGADSSWHIGNPFGDAFGSNVKDVMLIVGIVLLVIAAIVVVFIILYCYCKGKKENQGTTVVHTTSA
jgi:hypothetical protein